ncbi:hypothetical protein QFZ63_002738 [Streptomyces sp. B3I7]|uniref:hypothetical protein n=1 Tax=Streptomyces sp. B3I7 TaxID=3042269 RepID=UPI0027840E45|nr:hypothetical protein [Streptomyces sp. B3I7]MDQ0811024.1 hypothetical protein [Streptomyces sp. B3I7]
MNDHSENLGRRGFLTAVGLVGATSALSLGFAPAAGASPRTAPGDGGGHWSAGRSANGWPVKDASGGSDGIAVHRVEGSNASVALLAGDVATVLLHVTRRFHYEIRTLGAGDVHGHTTDRSVRADQESNHLSGTAVAICPDLYPAGARGGLFPHEVAVVRDILAECRAVVRWGGDDPHVPKEGHFQIDVPPGDAGLRKLADTVERWNRTPGEGAGAVDAFTPSRLRAAKAMRARQRA